MAKKKLSQTGTTMFKVDNIDWPFIMEALDHYEIEVEKSEFPKNAMMTKQFVLDRLCSLKDTFRIG